jgi:hypothetical protein
MVLSLLWGAVEDGRESLEKFGEGGRTEKKYGGKA